MFDQTAGAGFITSKFVPGTVQNDAPGPPPPPSIALLTTTHSGGTGNGPNLDATFNPSQFFAANKKNNNGNNSYNGYEQVGLVPVLRHQSSPSGSLTASVLTIPTPGSCPNAPLNQIRVLLVEDDDTCRRLSSKLLQIFGCNFDIAVDGLDAVNRMGVGYKYDIVLMDIVMPNLDGVSATTRIRQFDKLTPIISMTSNPTETDCITYLANGMNDILPKPFNKSSLLGMILRHVDKNKDTSPPPQDDGRITEVCDGPSMADEDLARRSNQAALVEASQSQNMNGDFDRQLLDLLRMDGNGEGSSSDNNINNNNAAGTDSRNMNIMNTLNPGYFPQNFDEPNRKRHHIEMDDGQDQKKNRR